MWRLDCANTVGVEGKTPPAATISARPLGSAKVVLPSPPAIVPSTLKRCWFSAMGSVCPLHSSQPSGAAAPSKRAASPTIGRARTSSGIASATAGTRRALARFGAALPFESGDTRQRAHEMVSAAAGQKGGGAGS